MISGSSSSALITLQIMVFLNNYLVYIFLSLVTIWILQEGVTTEELDRLAHAFCIEKGAYPSPLNYKWYPKSICTSVNNVACHGIPDERRLKDGDIVSVDVSVRSCTSTSGS